MDRNIQFHSLLKDELIYEVSIRSETPASTVEALRKQLRGLLLECPAEAVLETEFAPESELRIIQEKLKELGVAVDRYTRLKDRYSQNRSRALGSHLYHRIIRIQSDDPAILTIKTELSDKLEVLLGKVEVASTPAPHEVNPFFAPKEISVECSGDKNVSKWNLKFNGITDPRSFLERVDELQRSYGVSDIKLFNSAAQLFTEQALLWYRGIRDQVSCWSQLKEILLEEFGPVDHDYRLLGEIRSRTQGADEPVHIYFSIMTCMFARLKNPLSEDSKLEILLHNIRPQFSQQLALVQVTSIAQLKEQCRKLEAARQRADLFVEPSRPSSSMLGTDFAYKGKSHKPVQAVAASTTNAAGSAGCPCADTYSKGRQFRKTAKPICFKCGKTDHNFSKCNGVPEGGAVKCFGCGKVGVLRKHCTNCKNVKKSDKVSNKNSKNL